MPFLDKFMSRLRRREQPHAVVAVDPPAPRIISLSMVKNEQDIIEPFIRHNARLVDAMIILDNASVDATRTIAMDCARELGCVIVGDSDAFGYTQAERMTALLHMCQSAFFADFILPLDVDEFLGVPDRPALRAILQRIPSGGLGHVYWRTFVLTPETAMQPNLDPPRAIGHRRVREEQAFHKVVLRLDGAVRPDVLLEQGNHSVITRTGGRLPIVELEDLPLLHFPVRSREQLIAKGVVGWMAYLAMNPSSRASKMGFQWCQAFDQVVGGGLDAAAAAELSLRYSQTQAVFDWTNDVVADLPPSDYERRYSSGAPGAPLAVIAQSWERSLLPPPDRFEIQRPEAAVPGPGMGATFTGAGATAFDADWHWDHLFVDVAPFRFLFELERPASVLDIGCGVGAYLSLARSLGSTTIMGVDGIPAEATALEAAAYEMRDLAQPLDLGRRFDLVICVEVVEHLDPAAADTLLDSLTRHAERTIVFSAATPEQPGHGHINGQPLAHWLDKLAQRGWFPTLTASLGMRALASMSWFRHNLVVLRRQDDAAARSATTALLDIAAKPFTWYPQEPGIRQRPFLEPEPEPPAGYAFEIPEALDPATSERVAAAESTPTD